MEATFPLGREPSPRPNESTRPMPLILRWCGATAVPIGGEVIRPDRLALPATDAARLTVAIGNGRGELGDLFALEGDGEDGQLIVEGDLRTVHGLGAGMTGGRLEFRGDTGHRVGVGMTGGEIEVVGSVASGAGAELAGGFLRIRGDAGAELGAALPGSRVGMRGGVILIDGNAGPGVGTALRRGVIAVGGTVGDGAGRGMVAGSIFVGKLAGPGLGAGMKRGTIGLLGGGARPGPTFEPSGSLRPPVVAIYLRQLADWGFPVSEAAFLGGFRRYNGDRAIGGQGEIWRFG